MGLFDSLFGGGGVNPLLRGLLAPGDQDQLRNTALVNAGLAIAGGTNGLFPALQQGLQAGQEIYQQGAENALGAARVQQGLMEDAAKIARQARLDEARRRYPPLPDAKDPDAVRQWVDTVLSIAIPAGDEAALNVIGQVRASLAPKSDQGVRKIEEVVDPATGKPAFGYITPEGVQVIPGAAPFQKPGADRQPRLVAATNPKTGKPEYALVDEAGNFRFTGQTPGSSRDAAGTEGERKGAVLLTMAMDAAPVLDQADAPNRVQSLLRSRGLNEALSAEQQINEQAGLVIADAYIRLTSGANAPELEVQRTMQMITPRPGDAPALLARKRATRQAFMRALRIAAGRVSAQVDLTGTDEVPGLPPINSYNFGGGPK